MAYGGGVNGHWLSFGNYMALFTVAFIKLSTSVRIDISHKLVVFQSQLSTNLNKAPPMPHSEAPKHSSWGCIIKRKDPELSYDEVLTLLAPRPKKSASKSPSKSNPLVRKIILCLSGPSYTRTAPRKVKTSDCLSGAYHSTFGYQEALITTIK